MSSISAGTTLTTALVAEGDTSGQLVFKTNGSTTAVTIGTNQVMTLAQPLPVSSGGIGAASFTAYAIIAGGTTSTGPLQSVSGTGTTGQVLTSNGTGALPTWQTASGGAQGFVTMAIGPSTAPGEYSDAFTLI